MKKSLMNNVQKAKKIWVAFGDIPINESNQITAPFQHFEVGTDKFEIWRWFEELFEFSIAEDRVATDKGENLGKQHS